MDRQKVILKTFSNRYDKASSGAEAKMMHAPMRSFSNLADFLHPLSASPNDTLIDGQKEQGIKPPNQKAAENPLRLPSPQP